MPTMVALEITIGHRAETTVATGITTITSVEDRTAPTTSTRGSIVTIQCRRTRRRRTGTTAPVTLRTTPTWGAARSRGCWCRLPDVRRLSRRHLTCCSAHCERAFAQVATPQPDAVADRRHPRARR